ncbi:MAG: calcium/proton exchanger [Patescibacteria group bacterium]|nr:calcium/proton exchanger [Patescibacteria group bacterium]MDE2015627.1 calcium/proton exchanger [Patescibacteria group bacterium]MDE2226684.1 calcium/proton exchanger [Patescibacteria group bacterium]
MDKFFLALLAFVPLTVIGQFFGMPPIYIFFLSAIAIIPLAKYIGEATEELSARTGPAWGGLLNATFGNAVELIIGILAIKAGLIEVVRASITGSVIGNLLLVLGTAMFLGGLRHKKQEFNRTAAMASGSALFLAAIALTIPAIFSQTAQGLSVNTVEELSIFVAILIITLYASGLWFSLFTHKHLYTEEEVKLEPRWSNKKSVLILLFATLAVSWVSELLVNSIEPMVKTFGWTELFIGVIFVAIIGNAAEHTSAITMAMKNRMDLALQVAIGSATQIIMFVAPFLVIVSLFFTTQMSIIFNLFELVSIVLSIILVNLVVADGESNWLEGLQLVAAYAIIGIAFYLHP